MSLKGSLETVGLTDVLNLLAMTKKTGELQVTGEGGDGRLWVNEGQLIGSSAGRGPSHVDAIFELLRLTVGTFSFEDGEAPSEPGPATEIAPLLTEAAARLSQWADIEASIPSLAFTVSMARVAPVEEITIRADQWLLLAAAGSGKPVSAVLDVMEVGEFDGCLALKELADANLITVEEPDLPAVVFETADEPADLPRPASGDVDLSPIGQAGDPRLAPIYSHSDDSEEIDHPSESDQSGDLHPIAAAFGEMAHAPDYQPDEGFEPDQGDEGDRGFQIDQGYQPHVSAEADSGFQIDRGYQPDQGNDADSGLQIDHGFETDHGSDGDQGYQPYPVAPSDQAPLDYQAGQGYQAPPADSGYPAGGGDQTYQTDHDEVAAASFADYVGQQAPPVAEPPQTTDAVSPVAEGTEEPAAVAEGDAKVTPAEEPINRGLLLKFLSSVRT